MKSLLLLFVLFRCSTVPLSQFSIVDAYSRSVFVASVNPLRASPENPTGSGSCSGVILKTGVVLTAAHCIGVVIEVNGKPAQLLSSDFEADLMLLSAETAEIALLSVGPTPNLVDEVYAVGNFGPFRDVVSVGRVVRVDDRAVYATVISAPGVSGSGLYDRAGRLVGINNRFHGTSTPQGSALIFGSAVHPKLIKQFLNKDGRFFL